MTVRLALMTEPQQGLSYDEVLACARAAEQAGLEAFFRSDHFASFPGPAGLPTTEAWSTLAGLARETSTIHIGSLVSPVTFRIPGVLAKQVATVDEMSGGRVELGMGAGWNDEEHAQLGIPFPDLGERYDRFEEAVAIVHGLWTEPDGWRFDGAHWRVQAAQLAPRPAGGTGRRHPNLILGGDGGPRLARLVARFADEFNLVSASPDKARAAYQRIDRACAEAGRDAAEVTRSAMTGILIAESEGDLRDRVRRQLEMLGSAEADPDAWLAERRARWIMGTLDEARERVAAMAAAGVQRIMLQDFLPRDLDMIRLMPRLAG
jgi:F420-dependent oxidoreductase-like protein